MAHCPLHQPVTLAAAFAAMLCASARRTTAGDWPQLQHDSRRSGHTADQVLPRFRPRWVWYGPSLTLRNTLSNSSWSGAAIAPGDIIAVKAAVPAAVPFTIAAGVQPVIAGGRVFVGTMDGTVHALSVDDGATVWSAANPGGTVCAGACGGASVVFGSLDGAIRTYAQTDGTPRGTVATGGPITAAPVTDGTVACVASHDGHVYCVGLADGSLRWKSPYLGAAAAGGLAMDSASAYVGAENMVFHALRLSDGGVRLQKKLRGQSFGSLWPVVNGGRAYVETAPVPAVGSEYVGEDVMAGATSADDEQSRWSAFLSGGPTSDWKHLTVLSTTDFSEPFTVPCGPVEGCGTPPNPPVVDNTGRVLTYFKTNYVTLVKPSAFGTVYSIDISAIDQSTGRRVPIQNGATATEWFTWETDNLYGLATGGTWLYLRQDFRGTVCINLSTSASRLVSVAHSYQDGGNFANADIIHAGNRDTGARVPSTSLPAIHGRVPPAISGQALYFCERWCVVAAEHAP